MMTCDEKYAFMTKKVLGMPSILKDLLFSMVIEHRNLFMYFLKEYLDIYQEIKTEWGQYDPESVEFDMDPLTNINIAFRVDKYTRFLITYKQGELYNSELTLKINGKTRLSVKEEPENRPMVTIERY